MTVLWLGELVCGVSGCGSYEMFLHSYRYDVPVYCVVSTQLKIFRGQRDGISSKLVKSTINFIVLLGVSVEATAPMPY